jgi:hypothetical protein
MERSKCVSETAKSLTGLTLTKGHVRVVDMFRGVHETLQVKGEES